MTDQQLQEIQERLDTGLTAAHADASTLLTELSKARKLLAAASHGLKSYQFGNVGPDLAESLVSKIDEALNEPPAGSPPV